MQKNFGQLFLVSTPIGNLKDITLRAIEILRQVNEVICESTDIALRLLNHYQIKKPLIHLTDENQLEKIPLILEKLKNGKSLALICDAGTPTISDPGQLLVKYAIKENIKITPIPGPSAILSALITSGLPTQSFLFLGFLPKKEAEIKKIFHDIKQLKIKKEVPTIIFFESPNRLIKTLKLIKEILGEKTHISIAREMTKVYEDFIRGGIDEVIEKLREKKNIKGEITVVVGI